MRINTILDKIKEFLSSRYYPVILMALSFLCWVVPKDANIIFAVFYALFTFVPLLTEDGKQYLPIFLFLIPMSNVDISFSSVSASLIISIIPALISLIIFLFKAKTKLVIAEQFYLLLAILVTLLISYIFYSAVNGFNGSAPIFYMIILGEILILYLLLSTAIGRENSMDYFAQSCVFLSILIAAEVFIAIISGGSFFASPETFTLGWSYTRDTATSMLIFTLPFYGMIIRQKKPLWIIAEAFVILMIILLSNDAGLLCLILGFIPMMIMTFRTYGKLHAYYSLIGISVVGFLFIILIGLNADFFSRVISAIESLNFFSPSDARKQVYETGLEYFRSNLVLGSSLSVLSSDSKLEFLNSTILTTMASGGIVGLSFYVIFKVSLFIRCLVKKSNEKDMFLMFLIAFSLIGLISNSFYNIADFLFLLLAMTAYFMSDKPDDCVIHADFYENYDKISKLKLR